MPSRNCAFPQCTSSETEKHAGVKYFLITTRKSEYYDYDGSISCHWESGKRKDC